MEVENNDNDAMANLDGRVVLVAVMGTSPAVLTETVWALAHPDDGGEPVIPDEIIVITTLGGEAAIHAQLFGESKGWKRLLAAMKREKLPIEGKLLFGETRQSIRVLSDKSRMKDLSDVASSDDNAQMADDFLSILREFTEESARTQVYSSIAGGRKTMGALMLSCMSLLGRKDDHVMHVLVNPPFDGGVEPVFLFPEKALGITRACAAHFQDSPRRPRAAAFPAKLRFRKANSPARSRPRRLYRPSRENDHRPCARSTLRPACPFRPSQSACTP